MDILQALHQSLEEQKEKEVPISDIFMHPDVFRVNLTRLGCDTETIEDCLFEPPEKWEWLLQYFEDRKNEIKKDFKGD